MVSKRQRTVKALVPLVMVEGTGMRDLVRVRG